jgi:GNAT superfamily N-acetyltransferase
MADCATMAIATALDVREISVDRLLSEGQALFQEHWEEVGENRDSTQLKLDEARLRELGEKDILFVIGAYEETTLIGYCVCLIDTHLHDTDMTRCMCDALFVTKDYRGMRIGARLMRWVEVHAEVRGANIMQWHAMKGSELDRRLSESATYLAQDVTYTRRIT